MGFGFNERPSTVVWDDPGWACLGKTEGGKKKKTDPKEDECNGRTGGAFSGEQGRCVGGTLHPAATLIGRLGA